MVSTRCGGIFILLTLKFLLRVRVCVYAEPQLSTNGLLDPYSEGCIGLTLNEGERKKWFSERKKEEKEQKRGQGSLKLLIFS